MIGEQAVMKKSIVLGLALYAMSLNSLDALAAADEQYPASNFQPSVTYIDESAAQSQSSRVDDKYPASNFQPKVTYTDETVAQAQASTAAVVDEKYPAANFQSKVIFSDESAAVEAAPEQVDPNYPAAYFKPRVIYP